MQMQGVTDLRREVLSVVNRQINGDYSEALTRFSYLGGGILLINRLMPSLTRFHFNTVVDFGIGDGVKSSIIANALGCRSYIGVDISPEMIDIASRNQSQLMMHVNRSYIVSNFNNEFNFENGNNLHLLLGNTIANEVNMQSYLEQLNRNLNGYLLIGLELDSGDHEAILREYRNEINYSMTFRPLELIGVGRENGRVNIDFNNGRIEETFRFTAPQTITYGSQTLNFTAGQEILLSVTLKPDMEQLREWIENSSWNLESIVEENSFALVLLSN
jgi:uncharacterized SAM-dependent methyltransferase